MKNSFWQKSKNSFIFFTLSIVGTISFLLSELPVNNALAANKSFTAVTKLNRNLFIKSKVYPDTILSGKDSSALKDSSTLRDSSVVDTMSIDSLKTDTTFVDSMALDSTARIKYFKYQRNDKRTISVGKKKQKKWFLPLPSKIFSRKVQIDSTGNYVIITETFAGKEMKPLLKMPIEEYIKLRMESNQRALWEDLGYKYEVADKKTDLGDLMKNLTNIEIPLPSSKILSIFGKPSINLRINGNVDITGSWKSETTEGFTASRYGNTRNTPDLKQMVAINVSGTIGDKLTISADWDTERQFEYQNQLKIKYTGYEDEIIQSIEAGNVSLQTSSLVGGSEALFGIKAKFQMGPFSLIALASQKKGKSEEKNVSSGSTSQKFEKHVYEYSQDHFFLDSVYARTDSEYNFFYQFYGKNIYQPNQKASEYEVLEIELFKSITTSDIDPEEIVANAYFSLPLLSSSSPLYDDKYRELKSDIKEGEEVIGKRFVKLIEGSDYTLHKETGYITFLRKPQDNEAVAAAFTIRGDATGTKVYGELTQAFKERTNKDDSVRVLKLIKMDSQLQPRFTKAWRLQLRNIYPVGGRSLNKEGFKFDIVYNKPGAEPINNMDGTNFLEVFRLDSLDDAQNIKPDGKFDFQINRTIDTRRGEIIFPVLEPFGKDFPETLDTSLSYKSVYTEQVTFAKKNNDKDKFLLIGEYSGTSSSSYQIGFNVVENSVKVVLEGKELRAGTDFMVDYSLGKVTIINESALVPGANLKISYEENDLFSMASKTLFGFRGIYDINKETKLGFSYLNLTQKTLSDKVRIGEEPLSNSIYGVDFNTTIELPFITKGLSNIISTRTPSSISVTGEYAQINPDPNTKKSRIKGDNDKSIAYIDDFEGSKRILPIGVQYLFWKDMSLPQEKKYEGWTKDEIMQRKANTYWYNNPNANVVVDSIWGDRKKVGRNNSNRTVLEFVYNPTKKGPYNINSKLGVPDSNWGGMMTLLSSSSNNLIEQKIEFIEFWMKVEDAPEDAKLFIDLGQISEDVIPNGKLDKEDKNNNYRYDEGEDTGLDGLTDSQERDKYGSSENDPAGDNFNPGYFDMWNGTENSKSADSQIPDTEDLDNDGFLDQVNSYFRYEIPLSTKKISPDKFENPYISGGGLEGRKWFQFRIPLKEFKEAIGTPNLSSVTMMRMWVSGVSRKVHLRFVDLNFVGNQWEKVLVPGKVTKDDEVLTVETISYEDNPSYKLPPGVVQERDRTNTEETVLKNEQSLNLKIRKLKDGDNREVIKYVPGSKGLDVFHYKRMKLFVHGDEGDIHPDNVSHYIDENNYATEVYFRFGTDTSNFYEYRQPVRADWNEIDIDFATLTTLKETRDVVNELYSKKVSGKPGHRIGIKGNPTLTKISFFIFGVLNPKNIGAVDMEVKGDIWVNELRVLDADDASGSAYKVSANIKFANLMTVSLNASKRDPYFHALAERFGDRIDKSSWGGSVDFDLMKLVPGNTQGSNLKINYRHDEATSKPLYSPGTDIKVDKAAEQLKAKLISQGIDEKEADKISENRKIETQTLRVSDTWSLSNIKIKILSDAWYLKHTINSLAFSFSYNKSVNRSPSILHSRSWVWKFNMNYDLTFGRDNFFYPADIPYLGSLLGIFPDYRNAKIYFTPQTFFASMSADRNWSYSKSRTLGAIPNIQRDFKTARKIGFVWKLTEGGFLNITANYNANFSASLAHLLVKNGIEQSEKDIWREIFSGELFGKTSSFSQSLDFKFQPRLPEFWGINRNLLLNFGYRTSYSWQNNFGQKELGRSAGFQNNISFGVTLKLKSLSAPLFTSLNQREKKETKTKKRNSKVPIPIKKEVKKEGDLILKEDSEEEIEEEEGEPFYELPLYYLQYGVKWVFFDYEQISINFAQSNSQAGSGLYAKGTGFTNFWTLSSNSNEGPPAKFLFGIKSDIGPRAKNAKNLSDNFKQDNTINLKTSRPLWKGASIDISWRVSWGENKTYTLNSDAKGFTSITTRSATGKLDKTFFTIPFSGADISKVNELYNPNSPNPVENLAEAFEEGLESFPLFAKMPFLSKLSRYIPRPNWTLRWSGLEKLPLLKSLVNRASLSHSYSSSFTEGWRLNTKEQKEIQTQRISYGFSPLVGLRLTFDKVLGGNLTGNVNFGTKTTYDLRLVSGKITESFTRDISISASYSKTGFEIPLFGLSLKNDIEVSLNYTLAKSSAILYDMGENFKESGTPQDGTTRTTIEPKLNYTLSSKVKMAVFYKRITVETEGASRIPPTTSNEAGLEVHIAIN